MNNKFQWFLLAIIFFIESIYVLFTGESILKTTNYTIKVNEYSYKYAIIINIIGWIFVYIGYKTKSKEQKYTICPKCEESFNNDELENGKCKYCEDIDTIDIEKYYKNNPEKEDK